MRTVRTQRLAAATFRGLVLTLVSGAIGLGFNHARAVGLPLSLPEDPPAGGSEHLEIDATAAAELLGTGLFVDARSRALYLDGHVAGAIGLPYEEFETAFGDVADLLVPGVPIIVYCEGHECILSHSLAQALRQGGYDDVRVLSGGIAAWQDAGLPMEQGW